MRRPLIYADFNATTPIGEGARARMAQALDVWGNPSSAHQLGRQAIEFMEESRRLVAKTVGAEPKEVVFTSGGSEANTLALWGSQLAHGPDFRLLTSGIEHSSVRDTAKLLEAQGAQVSQVRLGPDGSLELDALAAQLDSFRPTLVSLMAANNETGTLFPISRIAVMCRERGIRFHTDAVQALGKIPSAQWAAADLVSVSAHKVYAPKGVGALVIRNGAKLVATHYGGSQEIKRRGGTENTLGIAAFAGACAELPADGAGSQSILRDRFEARLKSSLPDLKIQGEDIARLPNTTNVRFPGVAAQVLLTALDLDGVCLSAGSACSSGSITPSHVLLELGLSPETARECVRVSWGRQTTSVQVDEVADLMIGHVQRIRDRRRS